MTRMSRAEAQQLYSMQLEAIALEAMAHLYGRIKARRAVVITMTQLMQLEMFAVAFAKEYNL